MWLTAEAVKSTCIAVSDKLIELRSPVVIPKSRKKSTLMQACNPFEVLTGVKDISQLVFQLVRIIPDTAVQVYQIAVEIVVYLEVVAGRFMEQYPACTAEDLDISFIIGRKSCSTASRSDFLPPTHDIKLFIRFLSVVCQ